MVDGQAGGTSPLPAHPTQAVTRGLCYIFPEAKVSGALERPGPPGLPGLGLPSPWRLPLLGWPGLSWGPGHMAPALLPQDPP